MADEQVPLSEEQRRRNKHRVEDVERRLDGMEKAVLPILVTAAELYRQLYSIRAELREALQLPEASPPPPLVEALVERERIP
ncbi:MAG: hypothetical protein LC798_12930 [Chloroflexi bacterium]|nr:hypothetical protein [Chloroflexota bacterium]